MGLGGEYRAARHLEEIARLRRAYSLRAMVAEGRSQREIADELGISQPAVSQQLRVAESVSDAHPRDAVEAAAPVLVDLAAAYGFGRLAVFGSVARGEATTESDIDLLVQPPTGATISDVVGLQARLSSTLGRPVDLVTYGGLRREIDADILRDAVEF